MIGSSGKPRLVCIVNRPVISRQEILEESTPVSHENPEKRDTRSHDVESDGSRESSSHEITIHILAKMNSCM